MVVVGCRLRDGGGGRELGGHVGEWVEGAEELEVNVEEWKLIRARQAVRVGV
jgi:hypothetical protein